MLTCSKSTQRAYKTISTSHFWRTLRIKFASRFLCRLTRTPCKATKTALPWSLPNHPRRRAIHTCQISKWTRSLQADRQSIIRFLRIRISQMLHHADRFQSPPLSWRVVMVETWPLTGRLSKTWACSSQLSKWRSRSPRFWSRGSSDPLLLTCLCLQKTSFKRRH